VVAVLEHAVGDQASRIPVFAGDVVPRKKPAPDIYLLALRRLDLAPKRTLVIEDSRNGLLAAKAAGLRCLVTVSSYTRYEDLSSADLVVTSLGDPDGEQTEVLLNRTHATPGGYLTLDDLRDCLAGEVAASL
jgi:beta-phosphoglucomutase-like phosphatase (HAD superfamily)